MIGFLFVAKYLLGLSSDQLNVLHFLALGRLTDVRSVSADDPATFDADFIIEREREGMSLRQALQALVAFKRSQR
ncbi:hypothetical protein D3C71_1638030 [compost metagenome]